MGLRLILPDWKCDLHRIVPPFLEAGHTHTC